jgi:FkbM family methyltransferase
MTHEDLATDTTSLQTGGPRPRARASGGPVLVSGHRMLLHEFSKDRWITPMLEAGKLIEPFAAEWAGNFVRVGDICLDIGAHIGVGTLALARLVGPTGRVMAFEPEQGNFALLEANVRLNGYENVALHQAAVSNRSGEARLHVSDDNAGGHFLDNTTNGGRTMPVPTIILDELLESIERLDFIKLDIQGAETAALQGMKRLLGQQECGVLIVKFWPAGLNRAGSNSEELLESLSDFGFRTYMIDEGNRRLVQVTNKQLLQASNAIRDWFTNLLCVKTSL